MLISFRVRNFRSFADKAVLSMRPIRAYGEFDENICRLKRMEVLKTAAVYGPNAGGKSNLVKAIGRMRHLVLNSLRLSSVDELNVEPFELNAKTREEPTEFDMSLLKHGRVYRYGFVASSREIVAEWLFASTAAARAVERAVFLREGSSLQKIDPRLAPELSDFNMRTLLSNALLLPRLDQFNNECAKDVMSWFNSLSVLSGSHDDRYGAYSATHVNDIHYHDAMMRVVRFADPSIEDVTSEESELGLETLPEDGRRPVQHNIRIGHKVKVAGVSVGVQRRDNLGNPIMFDMDEKESEGTAKMFAISGPIADILMKGSVLVIDELEAKLHPWLTRRIVRLFHSRLLNPKNAQLIFVTHDATLLQSASLRRDQIWFCEKNRSGASTLYCLAEIKASAKARQTDNLEKKYLEGRFGGVPEFIKEEFS